MSFLGDKTYKFCQSSYPTSGSACISYSPYTAARIILRNRSFTDSEQTRLGFYLLCSLISQPTSTSNVSSIRTVWKLSSIAECFTGQDRTVLQTNLHFVHILVNRSISVKVGGLVCKQVLWQFEFVLFQKTTQVLQYSHIWNCCTLQRRSYWASN